jgi:osmotically-inducible protein OsmY
MTKDIHGCGLQRASHNVFPQGEAGERRKAGTGRNEAAMTDDELRRQVAAELSWDPQVDSEVIEVSAGSGTVTLRGTVDSLRQKQAGSKAAARVRGVIRVANELRVRIPGRDQRDDDDLRGDVLEALMLDGSVPMTVDAQARDGLVTLTGTAQWHYQREKAESRAAEVPGVARIDNAITLTQADADDAGDARAAIMAALRRDAVLEADALSVETFSGGLVAVSGTVRSWVAHDHAVAAAWSAPGVMQIDDRISVEMP